MKYFEFDGPNYALIAAKSKREAIEKFKLYFNEGNELYDVNEATRKYSFQKCAMDLIASGERPNLEKLKNKFKKGDILIAHISKGSDKP